MKTKKFFWDRCRSLDPTEAGVEVWSCRRDGHARSFDVSVMCGKPMDAFSLKRKMLEGFEVTRRRIQQENEALFSSGELENVNGCPVCGAQTDFNFFQAQIYKAHYVACHACTHRFVARRPTQAALKKFYAENENYQAVYADASQLQERLQKVVRPKLEWLVAAYQQRYGRAPKTILDVGAGSGHFVAAARQSGYEADGVELSRSGVAFAEKNFGLKMYCVDFIKQKASFRNYDIITFWGCLEHLAAPMDFLNAAKEKLSVDGLIAVEIPRWFSLSTATQKMFPDRIIRHLVPSAHIHMFTDSSLATAFVESGFSLSAAWYFGMDVYETAVLLASGAYQNDKALDLSGFAMRAQQFQEICDQNFLSDFMVLAGTPS